jgi:hypothetical protein
VVQKPVEVQVVLDNPQVQADVEVVRIDQIPVDIEVVKIDVQQSNPPQQEEVKVQPIDPLPLEEI